MTLAHLKQSILSRIVGATKIASDDVAVRTLLGDALKRIALSCVPLKLLTTDFINNDILRKVDESYYIMMPVVPENDTDEINIDSSLELAVIYLMCASLATNPIQPFQQLAQEVIDNHRWVAYEYLQRKEIVDELHNN